MSARQLVLMWAKRLFEPRLFGGCAAVERDLFAVVADTQQGGAVVGLAVLALDVKRLQFAAGRRKAAKSAP